jgi:hypothetical protein
MNFSKVIAGESYKIERLVMVSSEQLDSVILNSEAYKNKFDWTANEQEIPSRVVHCESDKAVAEIQKSLQLGFSPILIIDKVAEHSALFAEINSATPGCAVFTLEHDAHDIAALLVNPIGKLYHFWSAAFCDPSFSAELKLPSVNLFSRLFNQYYSHYLSEIDKTLVEPIIQFVDIDCLKPVSSKLGLTELESTIWPGLKLAYESGSYHWQGPFAKGYAATKLKVGNEFLKIENSIENSFALNAAINSHFDLFDAELNVAATPNSLPISIFEDAVVSVNKVKDAISNHVLEFLASISPSTPALLGGERQRNGIFSESNGGRVFLKLEIKVLKELLVFADPENKKNRTDTKFKLFLSRCLTDTSQLPKLVAIHDVSQIENIVVNWNIKNDKFFELDLPVSKNGKYRISLRAQTEIREVQYQMVIALGETDGDC